MVVIRLARHGAHKAPFYRIVVADQRKKRDGRIIEQVGTYDPAGDPSIIDLDIAKVDEWISKGAQPSDRVAKIIASVKNEPLPAKLAERIANKTEANRIAARKRPRRLPRKRHARPPRRPLRQPRPKRPKRPRTTRPEKSKSWSSRSKT